MGIAFWIQEWSLALPAILLAITVHEYAHGFTADRLGDPTPRQMGRLSLNPFIHLDIIGTLMLLIARVGWAKPVQIDFNKLKNPKRDMVWVALAGPGANILLAMLTLLALRFLEKMSLALVSNFIMIPLIKIMARSVLLNVGLAAFNLLPLPPLDGSRILMGFLPRRYVFSYSKLEPYGFIILLLLIISGTVGYVFNPLFQLLIRVFIGPFF